MTDAQKVSDTMPAPAAEANTESPEPAPHGEAPKRIPYEYVAGALLVLLVGVVLGITLANKAPSTTVADTNQQVTPAPVDHKLTTLDVVSAGATVSANKVSVPIFMDTGGNTVSAVELHIRVEPATVTGLTVASGPFFPKPTVLEKKAGDEPGTYVFTVGSLSPQKGSGVVALVSWTKQPAVKGSFNVRFDSRTQAAAIGETGTVLKTATDGVVQY